MIFKSITIRNLFSYYGEVRFDLARPEGKGGNIVIIKGRNGYGKTSFLNSVKLLFGWLTNDSMASAPRGSPSTKKSFVLGSHDWWGIMNHKARDNKETGCSVSAVLLDDANKEVRVTREWHLANGDYDGLVTVRTNRQSDLSGDEAKEYLASLLPPLYISFFFFDAEEVGYLAEANRNQTIEKMEQLLNIRPVDYLQDTLKKLRSEFNNRTLGAQAVELVKAEHRLEELTLLVCEWEQEKERMSAEIEELKDEIRRLQQKIRLLSGTGTIENAARLGAEKGKEGEHMAEVLSALSAAFEHDAFLRINPLLAQKAMQIAESCASSQGNATAELLSSLQAPLKEIFVTPPYPVTRLSDNQVQFYQARIAKLLDSRNVSVESEALFQIETGRAKKLASLLAAYLPEQRPAETMRENIVSALKTVKVINELENQLQNVRQLSDEDKISLQQLQYDLEQVQNSILDKQDRSRKIDHEIVNARRDIGGLEKDINSWQQKAKDSENAKKRLELLENMRKLLEAYKQQLKIKMREVLENAFNQHLKQLLDSNELIASARINDFFELSYHDSLGNSIPMTSLSAGMKQLAATALLWALKDASGRNLPVIIDTPLGRIDRQHQDNLLMQYYPHAAQQTILLPTDSELDERKSAVLAPHIYRTFHLHNASGKETHVELLECKQGVAYG